MPANWTPEARAKLSATITGHPVSTETRRKISAAMIGNQHGVASAGKHTTPHRVLGECVYCGGPATERDHVVPKRRGGTDDPSNLVLACHACNTSKGLWTPDEWLAEGLYAL